MWKGEALGKSVWLLSCVYIAGNREQWDNSHHTHLHHAEHTGAALAICLPPLLSPTDTQSQEFPARTATHPYIWKFAAAESGKPHC